LQKTGGYDAPMMVTFAFLVLGAVTTIVLLRPGVVAKGESRHGGRCRAILTHCSCHRLWQALAIASQSHLHRSEMDCS
jgi:hypothetical protein